ncbi:MAG TPA: Fe-S cluster assembly protein SufD [Alphaproteobacteria bacterium]
MQPLKKDTQPMLDTLRQAGAAYMQQNGLPTTRHEKWKYTSLKPLEQMMLAPERRIGEQATADTVPSLPNTMQGALENAVRITLVNGVYRADLSQADQLPEGVTLYSFANAANEHGAWLQQYLPENGFHDDQFLLALNGQYAQDGIVLHIAKKTSCAATPIIVQYVTLGRNGELAAAPMAHSRCVIVAEDHSESTIVEVTHGQESYGVNIGFDIHVGTHARLHHYRWQNDTQRAAHFVTSNIHVGRDASYDHFCLMMGSKLARHDVRAHLIAPNTECRVNGVYLAAQQQHLDTTILIEHHQPHGTSNQTFKGIVAGSARAVFQGKVHVHRAAQKTDGYQLNNALLLSRTAEVDVKPELEIYADDVKCSHGATTGQLDTGPLFYLRSRGLSEAQAKILLMQAFIGPALDEIRDENVRNVFTDLAMDWIRQQAV